MNLFRTMAVSLDFGLALEACGLDADPWAVDLLRSNSSRIIMNSGRQTGKTNFAAMLAACTARFVPGTLVVAISPSERFSKELIRTAKSHLESLGTFSDVTERDSTLQIILRNKSRIVALPSNEDASRGWSPHLVLLDEAARVSPETWTSLRPSMAATGGRLVVMSTPGTATDPFGEAWHGDGDWERISVKSSDCPRIPKEFLAEERRTMPAWKYATEYECAFARDSEKVVFPAHLVEQMFTGDVEPFQADWPRWAA